MRFSIFLLSVISMFLVGCGQSYEEISSVEDMFGEYTIQKVRILVVEDNGNVYYHDEAEEEAGSDKEIFEEPKTVKITEKTFPLIDQNMEIQNAPSKYSIEDNYIKVEPDDGITFRSFKIYKFNGRYNMIVDKSIDKIDGKEKNLHIVQEFIPK